MPTCLTVGWAVRAHHARAAAFALKEWESRILRETGLVVSIGRVARDDPDEIQLEELVFSDPETNSPVATVREVRALRAGDRGWLIELGYPVAQAGRLARFWNPIDDRLRHARGPLDWSGLLVADHLTLRGDGVEDLGLSLVECQLSGGESGAQARIQFSVDGTEPTDRASVEIQRVRSSDKPHSTVRLVTGSTPLPCALIDAWNPGANPMGRSACFRGSIAWRGEADGGSIEAFDGEFSAVDMFELVTKPFPHHLLTGTGTLKLASSRFVDGRLVMAEGTLAIPHGIISRSLIASAAAWLACDIDAQAVNLGDRIPFEDLDVRFTLDPRGLALRAAENRSRVLAASGGRPLLIDRGESVPVTQLIRCLVPDRAHDVPATRQTAWLVAVLPVPGTSSESGTSRIPDNPPVRLGDSTPIRDARTARH